MHDSSLLKSMVVHDYEIGLTEFLQDAYSHKGVTKFEQLQYLGDHFYKKVQGFFPLLNIFDKLNQS